MSIGRIIKAARKQLGMTEQSFGDAVGVTRGAVQQWEKGTTAPARKHQQRVADFIGISVGELMSGQAAKYPEPAREAAAACEPYPRYTPNAGDHGAGLINAMNQEGQEAALEYLRFLVERHPKSFSTGAAECAGDTLPRSTKAA